MDTLSQDQVKKAEMPQGFRTFDPYFSCLYDKITKDFYTVFYDKQNLIYKKNYELIKEFPFCIEDIKLFLFRKYIIVLWKVMIVYKICNNCLIQQRISKNLYFDIQEIRYLSVVNKYFIHSYNFGIIFDDEEMFAKNPNEYVRNIMNDKSESCFMIHYDLNHVEFSEDETFVYYYYDNRMYVSETVYPFRIYNSKMIHLKYFKYKKDYGLMLYC
tara:strand:- start:1803 stop:2444 length:642 start_codon:yes stop_codon:yes gene_type:complete